MYSIYIKYNVRYNPLVPGRIGLYINQLVSRDLKVLFS